MSYTPEQLDVVCPICKAARTGKCLEKFIDRSAYIETPHPERVQLTEWVSAEEKK